MHGLVCKKCLNEIDQAKIYFMFGDGSSISICEPCNREFYNKHLPLYLSEKPKMSFLEAMEALKQGKKVKREPFNNVYYNNNGIVRDSLFSSSGLCEYGNNLNFDRHDIQSNDWEIVED